MKTKTDFQTRLARIAANRAAPAAQYRDAEAVESGTLGGGPATVDAERLNGAGAPRLSPEGRKKYAALRRAVVSRARTAAAPFDSAARCLDRSRKWDADPDRKPIYAGGNIWSGLGGSDGRAFEAYGETACRWIENPENKGLRLCGFADEIHPAGIDHNGWYLAPDGWTGETVRGVVYALPARNGRARFLAGYADPWNCDKSGNGPALLSLEVFESDLEGERADARREIGRTYWRVEYENPPHWTDAAGESAKREAARRADGIAESMAEESRDYSDGMETGRKARGLAIEARATGKAWVQACRDARALWPARGGCPGLPAFIARVHLRKYLHAARMLRAEYLERRETARDFRDENTPGTFWSGRNPALDGFREGYADGEPV